MADPILPKATSPLIDRAGFPLREWYSFFSEILAIASQQDSDEAAIAALQAAVAALQETQGLEVSAPASVQVTLSSGLLTVNLQNDEIYPGIDLFYGVSDNGDGEPFLGYRTAVTTVDGATGAVVLWASEEISDAAYDLLAADRDKYLRFTYAGAKTLTVQDEADEPVVQDTLITGRVVGTGDLTIVEDTAVTVNPPIGGSLVIPPDTTFTLLRVAEDEWDLWYAAVDESEVDSVNGRTGAVVLTAADTPATVTTDSSTARSLEATDAGLYLRFTNAAAKTVTVQDNADEAIDVGVEIHGRNAGAGDLTITEDTAVTVNPPAGGTLVIPEGGTFTLKKVATDEWDLFGVTVAA